MKDELEYYRSRMRIDRTRLDAEVSEQADLHQRICERHALWRSKRAGLELAIEEAKSDATVWAEEKLTKDSEAAYRKACKKAEKDGVKAPAKPKVLVTSIRDLAKTDPKLRALHQELAEVKEQQRGWEGLREASTQRSFMMQPLADLAICGMTSAESLEPSAHAREKSDTNTSDAAYRVREAQQANRLSKKKIKDRKKATRAS
jgi:hypothetical protein